MENANKVLKDRQIYLLKKYFKVDEENKLVNVNFKYASASNVLINEVGMKDTSIFNSDILDDIKYYMDLAPNDYKVNIDISIDDYEGHEASELQEKLFDSIEFNSFSMVKTSRRNKFIASLLYVVGIIFLFVGVVFNNSAILYDSISHDVIYEVLDIVAWVFVWEATSIIFLSENENKVLTKAFYKKINLIKFFDKDSNLIIESDGKATMEEWYKTSKRANIIKNIYLITGAGFIASSAISVIQTIVSMAYEVNWNANRIIVYVFSLIIAIVYLFTGIGAIKQYKSENRFKYFTLIFVTFTFVSGLTTFIYAVASLGFSFGLFLYLLAILFCAAYIVVYICDHSNFKRKKKIK